MITIDGKTYHVGVTQLQRSAAVLDGDNAGRTMSGKMVRDLIGTYYNYELSVSTQKLDYREYDELYDIITAPVDSHRVTLPYGQSTLTFDAYVTNAKDNLICARSGANIWGGLSINFIAMTPAKKPG